jgi:hypothetical protein
MSPQVVCASRQHAFSCSWAEVTQGLITLLGAFALDALSFRGHHIVRRSSQQTRIVSFRWRINYHSRFKLCRCHICYFSRADPASHGVLSGQVMDISLFMRCKSDFKVSLPISQ